MNFYSPATQCLYGPSVHFPFLPWKSWPWSQPYLWDDYWPFVLAGSLRGLDPLGTVSEELEEPSILWICIRVFVCSAVNDPCRWWAPWGQIFRLVWGMLEYWSRTPGGCEAASQGRSFELVAVSTATAPWTRPISSELVSLELIHWRGPSQKIKDYLLNSKFSMETSYVKISIKGCYS